MTQNSIFKTMISSFFSKPGKTWNKPTYCVSDSFVLPQYSTIQAIENGEDLSMMQIEDYIKYIANNYYLSAEQQDDLLLFGFDFTRYSSNVDKIKLRQKQASQNIINCLMHKKNINVIDALWLSNTIYVDDDNDELRRIVTKEFVDDKVQLKVTTAKKSENVSMFVDLLKHSLKHNTKQNNDKNI